MSLREYLAQISIPVYVLVSTFAWSSWIDINGLFVETPLLVNILPERWRLFSYLTVVIQVANTGPILYMILRKRWPELIQEWRAIYLIVSIGATACFLLAFFWQETTVINGQPHSTALFVLASFLALVDCTSSVVYLPYMGQYKPQYMTAFYIGEGLSGMIPGFVGLIQGVQSNPECLNVSVVITNITTGENTTDYRIMAEYPQPTFSVQTFFFFLFAMMLISGTSFTLLHFHPFGRKERRKSTFSDVNYDMTEDNDHLDKVHSEIQYESPTNLTNLLDSTSDKESLPVEALIIHSSTSSTCGIGQKITKTQFIYILVLTCWLNALVNGVLPSTNSYTCLPYGSLAFTLAVRLSTVANPIVCLLSLFIRTKSLNIVGILSLVATGISGWHLYLAAMSPDPPLKGTIAGTGLVILTYVTNMICIVYVNVSNASILNEHGGQHSLLWFGGATQIGSCVGAIVTFFFVNVLSVFQSESPCPGMSD
ncbi:hypothetical protein LSH36_1190g00095 [Paralvinella palmiformis]|uniref:Riboflavin transporter n=1 Tax=Paralvinella palmiformis TaxID=53620 RepID=A0AAD9IU26_9ANNE|nr:hypothetical protein LSH36_1190g00095 [Paralvinella palmiformis]